jgi:hypothetical protein
MGSGAARKTHIRKRRTCLKPLKRARQREAYALGARISRVTISRFPWAGSSMVEQLPLKQRVVGSSPTRLTTSFQ